MKYLFRLFLAINLSTAAVAEANPNEGSNGVNICLKADNNADQTKNMKTCQDIATTLAGQDDLSVRCSNNIWTSGCGAYDAGLLITLKNGLSQGEEHRVNLCLKAYSNKDQLAQMKVCNETETAMNDFESDKYKIRALCNHQIWVSGCGAYDVGLELVITGK